MFLYLYDWNEVFALDKNSIKYAVQKIWSGNKIMNEINRERFIHVLSFILINVGLNKTTSIFVSKTDLDEIGCFMTHKPKYTQQPDPPPPYNDNTNEKDLNQCYMPCMTNPYYKKEMPNRHERYDFCMTLCGKKPKD